VDFRILGSLEVVREGDAVDIGGTRLQIVLALLLLEAPRIVSVDQLIDAVWDEGPPSTARSQVHICVSQLRTKLGSVGEQPLIRTRKPGYVLDLGGASLDLVTFQALAVQARKDAAGGRRAEAAHLLRTALAEWRGPLLGGLDVPFVRDAAVRLEDARVAALEEYADLELEFGRHAELVPVLRGELSHNPLRERLRGRLMLALYRAGRRSDALEEFRRARATAVEELGIEPAEELRALMDGMLRSDPLLDAPGRVDPTQDTAVDGSGSDVTPVPRLLPPDVADFTGRQAQVAAATRHLTEAGAASRPSPTPVVVVSGPGGAGKSTFALHVAHQVAADFPDGQLYLAMHGTTRSMRPAEALERFLRALGVPGQAVPESLDERAEAFRGRISGRRMLVVLDDVADDHQILPLLPPAGCAVVVTSRRRLTALPGATRLELGSFSVTSAVELLTKVIGHARVAGAADEAVRLVELCDQLPLAVRIVAARLAARPHWPLTEMIERLSDETGQLDELRHGEMAVRASLDLTYGALGAAARQLLRGLALLDGPDFGDWVCAPLLGVRRRDAHDALDELVETHLVEVVGNAADTLGSRYQVHDLVRAFGRERAVAEEPPPSRTATHERYLGALAGLLDEAHRRQYGGDFLTLHGSVARYPLDERTRDRLLTDPLAWLSAERPTILAAVVQASSTVPGVAWDLAMTAVVLFEARSHFDDWRQTHEAALAAARREDDRLGEAAMLYSVGSLAMFEMRLEPARTLFAEAILVFTDLGHEHGRAMTLRNQAIIDAMTGDSASARHRYRSALEVFRGVGDKVGEAYVLRGLAEIDVDDGREADGLERLLTASTICSEVGNRRVAAQIAYRLGSLHLQRGDHELAEESFTCVLDIARDTGDRIGEMHGLIGRASVRLELGDRHAVDSLRTAERIAVQLGDQRMQGRALLLLGRAAAALDLGDGCTARDQTRRALEISERLGTHRWSVDCLRQLGEVEAACGEPDAADRFRHRADTMRASLDPVAGAHP
jgi:DNA-binding SARP family transcriptional activator/tetratricopeptide (TPR) repeat protein